MCTKLAAVRHRIFRGIQCKTQRYPAQTRSQLKSDLKRICEKHHDTIQVWHVANKYTMLRATPTFSRLNVHRHKHTYTHTNQPNKMCNSSGSRTLVVRIRRHLGILLCTVFPYCIVSLLAFLLSFFFFLSLHRVGSLFLCFGSSLSVQVLSMCLMFA